MPVTSLEAGTYLCCAVSVPLRYLIDRVCGCDDISSVCLVNREDRRTVVCIA